MHTAVEETNIETILAVMSTTELVVINTSLSALFSDFSNMFCLYLSLKTIPMKDCFVDQERNAYILLTKCNHTVIM